MSNADQSDKQSNATPRKGQSGKRSDDKQARLSKALRDNLRRRKAQVRARKVQDAGSAGQSDSKPEEQDTSSGQDNRATSQDQI